MKKILSAFLSLLIIISLCSCNDNTKNTEKLNIVTTIFPQYDFARQICKDKADIKMLINPGTEGHSYEPTPQDIMAIKNSDIFIYTGGASDVWVDEILSSIEADITTIIPMIDLVDLVKEEITEGMTHDEEHNHIDKYDEHIWTSPKNAITITTAIYDAVKKADADNIEFYQKNYESYINELKQLDDDFKNLIDNSTRKTLVFGDRFPFKYFTNEYGLSYYAAFPGCSDKTEPGAKTLAFLIDKVKKENIPVVFYIEFSNKKIADTISYSTGAKGLLLHSCHNVSKDEFDSGITYVELMRKNLLNLEEALK